MQNIMFSKKQKQKQKPTVELQSDFWPFFSSRINLRGESKRKLENSEWVKNTVHFNGGFFL